MTNLVNMLLFQGAWFAGVMGAAEGLWWAGPAALLPLLAHFVVAMRASWPAARSLAYLSAFAIAGAGLEFVQTRVFGSYAFAATGPHAGIVWMAALWCGFATTLPLSLRWIARRPLPATVGGLVFGPLSFVGGEKLGAVVLGESRTTSVLVLAAVWSLAFPLAGWLTERALRSPEAAENSPTAADGAG